MRDKTIIRAQSLEVSLKRDGGRIEMVFGDCELAVGDAPDKAKAIARAMSNGHGPAAAPPTNAVEGNGVPDALQPVNGKSGRHKKSEETEHQPES